MFRFPVLPSLIDRLGDAKDSVREQDQTLLLKIMEQAANPQVGQGRHSVASWCACTPLHQWVTLYGNIFFVSADVFQMKIFIAFNLCPSPILK